MLDPLFYTQGMMAQLDMPAMLFTVLALLLFCLDRHAAAAAACTALVLAKETGALLPLIFGLVLFCDPARSKYAVLLSRAVRRARRLVLRRCGDPPAISSAIRASRNTTPGTP